MRKAWVISEKQNTHSLFISFKFKDLSVGTLGTEATAAHTQPHARAAPNSSTLEWLGVEHISLDCSFVSAHNLHPSSPTSLLIYSSKSGQPQPLRIPRCKESH